jgi:hypothetical protein
LGEGDCQCEVVRGLGSGEKEQRKEGSIPKRRRVFGHGANRRGKGVSLQVRLKSERR